MVYCAFGKMVQKRSSSTSPALPRSEASHKVDESHEDSTLERSQRKQGNNPDVKASSEGPSVTNESVGDTTYVSSTAFCLLCGFSAENKTLFDKLGNATPEYSLVNKYFGPKLDFSMGASLCHVCEVSLRRLEEIDTEHQNLEQKLWERMQITSLEGSTRFDNLFTKFLQKRNRRMCNQLVSYGMEGYFVFLHGEDNPSITYTGTPLAERFLKECPNEMDRFKAYCRSGDVNNSGSSSFSSNRLATLNTQHSQGKAMYSLTDNRTLTACVQPNLSSVQPNPAYVQPISSSVQPIPANRCVRSSAQGSLSQQTQYPFLVHHHQPTAAKSKPQVILGAINNGPKNTLPNHVTIPPSFPITIQEQTKTIGTTAQGKRKGEASQTLSTYLTKRAKSQLDIDQPCDKNSVVLWDGEQTMTQCYKETGAIPPDQCFISEDVHIDPSITVKVEPGVQFEHKDNEFDQTNLKLYTLNPAEVSTVLDSSAPGQMYIVQDGPLRAVESRTTGSGRRAKKDETMNLSQNPVPMMLIGNVHKDINLHL